MKLAFDDYEHLTVMKVTGELTADDAERFRKAALERIERHVRDFVLDLAEVEFVDSKGLESLLWLQETCIENLGQVRLAALTQNVQKILELTRLSARFEREDDVEAAIKSLR